MKYALIKSQLKNCGNPIPENDVWIAAIAEEQDMTIVTRDKHLLLLNFIKSEQW